MSGIETRLRQLLEESTGEPPSSISVSEVRRLARRRRALHGFGAAFCAAVSVLALGLAAAVLGSSPAQRPVPPERAVGVPGYYIQELDFGTSSPEALVRATATGMVTATVRCPWAGAVIRGLAPAGTSAFFMACQRASLNQLGSRLYRFRLTGTGSVPGYSLLPGGELPGLSTSGLTAAADGSEIAMTTSTRGAVPNRTTNVLVINTTTGAHAVWTADARFSFWDFTLGQDGRYLTFVRTPHVGSDQYVNDVVAQVSPASLGGQLNGARVLVQLRVGPTFFTYARISPDGSALTIGGFQLNVQRGVGTMIIDRISVASGKVIGVLFHASYALFPPSTHTRSTGSDRAGDAPALGWGGSASSDSSGQYIIVTYGPTTDTFNGWLHHGRLVPLRPARGPVPGNETW